VRRFRTLAPLGAALLGLLAAGFAWGAEGPAARPEPVVDPTVAPTVGLEPPNESSDGTSQRTGAGITPLFAPIPFRNSQLGWGLAVMVGAIHRFDPDTTFKPSTGALMGFYSENDSWGLMAIEVARLAKDTWRLRGIASHMDIRYSFYGIGEDAGDAGKSLPIEQPMDFAVGAALYRILPGLYGGGSVLWMRSEAKLQLEQGEQNAPPQDLANLQLVAPGIQTEYDTRDNDFWPRRGSIASFKASFYTSGLGSARDFQRYVAAWSWYCEVRGAALVLATNLNAARATGDVPFWAVPSVGTGRWGLRGYTQGRYRDNLMTTVQAELRGHTAGRWGGTIFGGLAYVAPSAGALDHASPLPAGGLGVRFKLTERYPMHMRADYAWGKNESLFYFSVSEAF
jgi:hypothetical protein